MAFDNQKQMKMVVKIADIRKQRLANAAADAARELMQAQARLADAAALVEGAKAEFDDAGGLLAGNPANEQLLIWRNRCSAAKDETVETQMLRSADEDEARAVLSQNLRALQRQNLRHDHLAELTRSQQHALRRSHESRADDEQQGSGQQSSGDVIL